MRKGLKVLFKKNSQSPNTRCITLIQKKCVQDNRRFELKSGEIERVGEKACSRVCSLHIFIGSKVIRFQYDCLSSFFQYSS